MDKRDKLIEDLVNALQFYATACIRICNNNGIVFYDYADKDTDAACGAALEAAMQYLFELDAAKQEASKV